MASPGHNELRAQFISVEHGGEIYVSYHILWNLTFTINLMWGLSKLEQLERLHSEIPPGRPMITHSRDSYQIQSQNKTKSKLQIWKIAKKSNFLKNFICNTPSEVAW